MCIDDCKIENEVEEGMDEVWMCTGAQVQAGGQGGGAGNRDIAELQRLVRAHQDQCQAHLGADALPRARMTTGVSECEVRLSTRSGAVPKHLFAGTSSPMPPCCMQMQQWTLICGCVLGDSRMRTSGRTMR